MRNVDWYDAGFVVYEIDPETDADMGELAAAKSLMVAKAAFWAALEQKPKSRLLLRRKSHVIEDELGPIAKERSQG